VKMGGPARGKGSYKEIHRVGHTFSLHVACSGCILLLASGAQVLRKRIEA
jgi:hypothetical protein